MITQLFWEPTVGVAIPRPSSFVWLLIHVRLGACDRQMYEDGRWGGTNSERSRPVCSETESVILEPEEFQSQETPSVPVHLLFPETLSFPNRYSRGCGCLGIVHGELRVGYLLLCHLLIQACIPRQPLPGALEQEARPGWCQ